MTQRPSRLIGGVYRVGQIFTTGPMLTNCAAYNRNTNDVVGLQMVELPATMPHQQAQALLPPLAQRSQVHSENVLPVYDWGLDGQLLYIVTEPPRGVSLRYVLDNENVDSQRALELIRQVTRGVVALHAQGLSGFDLRPLLITVNVIEAIDYALVDDIGLRPLLNALGYQQSQRTDDIAYFDPRYSSPEQIRGEPVGPWSDIYQLGLLLFELVTGRLPFVGRNQAETGVLQVSGPLPRLEEYTHEAPPLLQAIIERTLAKSVSARFASAQAVLRALESVEIEPHSTAQPAQEEPALPRTGQTAPNQALTHEMQSIDVDVSRQSTHLQSSPSNQLSPSPNDTFISPEAADGIFAYLVSEGEDQPSHRFPLSARDVVVGRADPKRSHMPDIDLTPVDPKMIISRQHARIRYEETFFYIEDLKSFNGSWLGELKLSPLKAELLQHGDRLRFGSIHLTFIVPGQRVTSYTLPDV